MNYGVIGEFRNNWLLRRNAEKLKREAVGHPQIDTDLEKDTGYWMLDSASVEREGRRWTVTQWTGNLMTGAEIQRFWILICVDEEDRLRFQFVPTQVAGERPNGKFQTGSVLTRLAIAGRVSPHRHANGQAKSIAA